MEINDLPVDKNIILFDGECLFCDGVVQKIIENDKKNVFVFASLQSEIGKKIIRHIGMPTTTDSIVFYRKGYAYFIKAEAILEIAKHLKGWYPMLGMLRVFPNALLNIGYSYFAKNRYKWFGKKDQCTLPSEEVRSKFLE